jgi:hypothetical protein
MSRTALLLPSLLLASTVVWAEEAPKTEAPKAEAPKAQAPADKEKDSKELDGMSILGNQEAPKALVIVPWKSSELGDALGIAPMLDDARGPVDRDVFMRSLNYYEIRSETTRPTTTAAPRSKS